MNKNVLNGLVIFPAIIWLFLQGCAGKEPPLTTADTLSAEKTAAAEEDITPLSSLTTSDGTPKEVFLSFFSEPVRVTYQPPGGARSSTAGPKFARLSGLVLGKICLATFAYGEGSLICRPGEKVGDYVLSQVCEDGVVLRLAGNLQDNQ